MESEVSVLLVAAATVANAVLAGLLFNHVTVSASDTSAAVLCFVSGPLSALVAWFTVRVWRGARTSSGETRRGFGLVSLTLALLVDGAVFLFVGSVGLLFLIGPTGR